MKEHEHLQHSIGAGLITIFCALATLLALGPISHYMFAFTWKEVEEMMLLSMGAGGAPALVTFSFGYLFLHFFPDYKKERTNMVFATTGGAMLFGILIGHLPLLFRLTS